MILDLESKNKLHRSHCIHCVDTITLDGVRSWDIVRIDTDARLITRFAKDSDGKSIVDGDAFRMETLSVASYVRIDVTIRPTCRCPPEALVP